MSQPNINSNNLPTKPMSNTFGKRHITRSRRNNLNNLNGFNNTFKNINKPKFITKNKLSPNTDDDKKNDDNNNNNNHNNAYISDVKFDSNPQYKTKYNSNVSMFNQNNNNNDHDLNGFKALTLNNKHRQTLIRIKDYEISYNIPIGEYMYDILGIIRLNNQIESQNINFFLKYLKCNGSIFADYFRNNLYNNNNIRSLNRGRVLKSSDILELTQTSKIKYDKYIPQIPISNQIKYLINGIWEIDVKIIRAFNDYIHKNRDILKFKQSQIHIRIWSKGLTKKDNNHDDDDDKNGDDDDNDDDDDDDDYDMKDYDVDQTIDDNDYYDDIINNCGDIKLEEIMNRNTNIKKIKRKITYKDKDDDKKIEYEPIDGFVASICENDGEFVEDEAVNIVFDTRCSPDITAYIWYKSLIIDNNINLNDNIGNYRINSAKNKYFQFNFQNRDIDIGQYIGLSTFILNNDFHQFWCIYNTEIRFHPSHAIDLWPNYYVNQTEFAANADFDNDYNIDNNDNDNDNDNNDRKKYEKYYGKAFISSLHNKNTAFCFKDLHLLKTNLPDLKAPHLDNYKPFKYHWNKANDKNTLEEELRKVRPIQDLTPKSFKRVYDDATLSKAQLKKKPKKNNVDD